VIPGALEVVDTKIVKARSEYCGADRPEGAQRVNVDNSFAIDEQLRSVVGLEPKSVLTRVGYIEVSCVLNGEPLETVGYPRKAFSKLGEGDVESFSINRSYGFEFGKIRFWTSGMK
jgi:hypothetical protein